MKNGHDNLEKLTRTWAELEWVWVLINPVTAHRDSILVIEMEGPEGRRRVMPIFETREAARAMKSQICRDHEEDYEEQAISLGDVGRFAAKENLEIMLLNEEGRIMARLSAQLEDGSLQ